MSLPIHITDGTGRGTKACVTSIGQVVTAPYAYDLTVFNELAEPDTAYNFYEPKQDQQFVITGFVAKADKQVSSTVDADVVIYEAEDADATTVTNTLFQVAMVEGDLVVVSPLNILVTEGVYVNGKTTDDDIHMTIMGYYIPKLS